MKKLNNNKGDVQGNVKRMRINIGEREGEEEERRTRQEG